MKEFKAESKKLLDLVINSIYTNREIFLRELISNASDALDKRRFLALTDSSLDAELGIELKVDKVSRTLTVSDNGVGMNAKELEDNLGVIAASGTENFKKEIGKTDAAELIGCFGVGFYASFMVADKVTVISRKLGEDRAYKWESDGATGFEITDAERAEAGTDVILTLKQDGDENYSQYLETGELRSVVKKYSDYVRYPVRAELPKADGDDGIKVGELSTLNSMTPVWKKPKDELGDAELDEFYKHTYRDYRDPIMHVSMRAEGAVEYTALLFVPSEPSFDYYTKDHKRGLQLYCNGVLIMDKCAELIPEYLGFVRGVVDTPDLSLNVSRETLQHDRRLRTIAVGLEKKLLGELEKLLKNDREKYDRFFTAFSKAVKFGAYDNFGENKDKLKDLLLYYSDAEKRNVTLKEYVQKLPDEKAAILYACGETVDKIFMLPQLEGAREAGKDVLYFTEPVDEFIARMLESYDGHKFENIASGAGGGAKTTAEQDELLKRISEKIGIAAVATDRLKTYPVCLAAKGEVSLEMERIMESMGGGVKAERVLQVNLDHPAVAALAAAAGDRFSDLATVLYNEALLAEGYKTEQDFIPALNRILGASAVTEKSTAAAKKPASTVTKKASATAAKKPASTAVKKATATKKTAAKKQDGANE